MTRVLVVDDEPQILRALRINLQARRYDVVAAADGTQAIAAVEAEHPDVVVLDLGLPDIDGVHVIRAPRAWTPVPVIVLSGRRSSTDKIDALDAGADDYVTKPFDIGELLARLRAVTRRHGPAGEPGQVRIGRYTVDLATRDARHDDGHRPPRRPPAADRRRRRPGAHPGAPRVADRPAVPRRRPPRRLACPATPHRRRCRSARARPPRSPGACCTSPKRNLADGRPSASAQRILTRS
ncbi:response regulator transcription factor [Dactylosporangium aurantiacum]|uniref:Response regulator transcription factor n=1 Tax=Dactylosporangium aurantiacum TaxID=35754 RepID=A0A9Q9IF24_9ACTN|nr:response regulator transcription factor [Dactylosporangium aurantiacum]MDG6107059.1 response regulator transcription factor [Dactylosporangium aurantiacum]UWZ51360.1 response regulator transcription factor [Dactylosporangium aurantiacum]